MTEHLLQVPYRGAVFKHVRSACVTKGVSGHILFKAGKASTSLDHIPDTAAIHFSAPPVDDQMPAVFTLNKRGAHRQYLVVNQFADSAAQRNHAFLVAFSQNVYISFGQIQGTKGDRTYLSPANCCIIQNL